MSSTDVSIQKLPPQNLEAEQAVLAAILLDNQAFNKVVEILSPEDFYKESHRKIFSALQGLDNEGEAIDLITLSDHLRKKDQLEKVGGSPYLTELLNSIPTAANVRLHANIVHEKAILRHLIGIATNIVTEGYEDQGKVGDLLDRAERSIFSISDKTMRSSFSPMKELVPMGFEIIERLADHKLTGLPTFHKDLDQLMSGLQPSDLIIVAGRPSMGKTAFALGIAQNIAVRGAGTVGIFSLEMSKEQLVLRMLCSEARVDAHKLRSGFLGRPGNDNWKKLIKAAGRLNDAPIFIDDTPAMTILEMRAKARRLKAEHNLSLLIVDYLQLMRGRGDAGSREQEISDISRSLKGLAKELRIPVIALSQLSRAVESRPEKKKRPILADLRESGAIEQDADVVLFIYREEVYDPCKCPREGECVCGRKGKAEIIIGKQRNGPIDDIPMTFIDRYTRFEDRDPSRDDFSTISI
ncbi:MAG: replicative DNA helicase [Nitrospira sp.]|nr:replicative DNA helicase [Candidatus Manganitrophaceae bacterium]HIL35457.1 replicative DNA helicase [Candidatus Manganitrophaceae bacterium]